MYRLIRFGTVNLEHFNQNENIGSGATPTAYQALAEGGALDQFGNQQKHPGTVERTKSIRLRGATQAELANLYLQLLALRGTRNRLFRRTITGDIHWQYARLVEVSAQRTFEQAQFRKIQDLELRFITQEIHWRGDLGGTWTLDSGELLDSGLAFDSGQTFALSTSPTAITVTTSDDIGRAPIRAVRLRVTAGSLPITAITIARAGGESLTFNGTINAGDELIIDAGTMQVTNDGADAYDDLSLSPTADLASWFSFETGDNALAVTFTGGGTGSTLDFSYYEVWY